MNSSRNWGSRWPSPIRSDAPVPLRPDLVLVAMAATLITGEPHPHEHSAVRWVDADDLRRMTEAGELVPADAVWLDDLIALL